MRTQNATHYEKAVNKYIDDYYIKATEEYKYKIESQIKDGLSYQKSFENIESDLQQKLATIASVSDYKYLKKCFLDIQNDYAIDKFNKALASKEFKKELEAKDKTLEEFLAIHKVYLAEDEMLKFHHQNKAIFERYFKIKYNENLKYRINYDDLKLYKGTTENDGLTIDEWSRLEEILNPPKKKEHNTELSKFAVHLTTKDVAVFMILFKNFYKLNFNSYTEFVELTRLIFDKLHYNILSGDTKKGTSIKRYLNGKELFSSNFNFESSKVNILRVLSEINLKDFKSFVEKVKIDKFKSLIR